MNKQDALDYLQAVKRRIDDEAAARIEAMPEGRLYDRMVDAIEAHGLRDIEAIETVEGLVRMYGPDEHVAGVREHSQEGLAPTAELVRGNGWREAAEAPARGNPDTSALDWEIGYLRGWRDASRYHERRLAQKERSK